NLDRYHRDIKSLEGHVRRRLASCTAGFEGADGESKGNSITNAFKIIPMKTSTVANEQIAAYSAALSPENREICDALAEEINRGLPEAESKIWHAHPVWFLEGNPIVGYSKLKNCVRLLFWSGQSFDEEKL